MRPTRVLAALTASVMALCALSAAPPAAAVQSSPRMTITATSAAPVATAHALDVMWFGVAGQVKPSQATIDGALTRMSEYWVSQSGGVIPSLSRTVKFGANVTAGDLCNAGELWRRAAAAYGHSDPSWYTGGRARHLVVLAPSIPGSGCSGIAYGTQGAGVHTGGRIYALVDPSSPIDWDYSLYNSFGRNLGLGNSAARYCTPPRIDAAFSTTTWSPVDDCVDQWSNDVYDVMSGAGTLRGDDGEVLLSDHRNIPALNVTHKVELGFLRSGAGLERITLDDGVPRTVTLAPASATAGVRGIEIVDPVSGERLYLEFRSGTGRDAASFYARAHEFFDDGAILPGVRVLRRVSCAPCTDTKPRYSTVLQRLIQSDAGITEHRQWLGAGHSLTSWTNGVRVTVLEATSAAATVRIEDSLPDITSASTITIAGTPRYGATISATGSAGWAPQPSTVTYQWLRDGVAIPGASSSAYQVDGPDIGAAISLRVTANKRGFSAAAVTTAAVEATGPTTARIAGASRYETAVEVSRDAFPAAASVVYLATGADYPDALAAAPAAAAAGGPLLLVPSVGAVPQAVLDRVAELDPDRLVIVGGASVVAAGVVSQVKAVVPAATVTRLAGSDRYATARAVADSAFPSRVDEVFIATGRDYPDALAAAAVAGRREVPVILVDGTKSTLDAQTLALLARLNPSKVTLVGGPSVVSAGIESRLKAEYLTVRRSGASRYETAVAVNRAESADAAAGTHFVATGMGFADALAGAVLAAVEKAPLSLVQPTCVPATAAQLIGEPDPARVVLIGGVGALGYGVQELVRCR